MFGAIGVSAVVAQAARTNHSILIENLASAFNLNTADVEKVFTDTRTQLEEDRLSQAVEDGKISEDQKALILQKRNELQAKEEEINNTRLTVAERMEKMKELRDELKSWADENDIPLQYVMGRFGHGPGFGRKMRGEMMF